MKPIDQEKLLKQLIKWIRVNKVGSENVAITADTELLGPYTIHQLHVKLRRGGG
jgi:hypothetical protein